MIDQAEYKRLKRRLAVLEGKLHRSMDNYCVPVTDEDDPRVPIYKAILEEVREAFAVFDQEGYPDTWSHWQNAADDAAWQLSRFYPTETPLVAWDR